MWYVPWKDPGPLVFVERSAAEPNGGRVQASLYTRRKQTAKRPKRACANLHGQYDCSARLSRRRVKKRLESAWGAVKITAQAGTTYLVFLKIQRRVSHTPGLGELGPVRILCAQRRERPPRSAWDKVGAATIQGRDAFVCALYAGGARHAMIIRRRAYATA